MNIDAYPNSLEQHRRHWNPKNVKNFIWADAHYLPFKKKVFRKTILIHVLEHLHSPIEVLKEINRISQEVLILTPSEFDIGKTTTHIYTWNPFTLENLLKLVFLNVDTGYTDLTRILSPTAKMARAFPFLNGLLSHMGLHPELFAIANSVKKQKMLLEE